MSIRPRPYFLAGIVIALVAWLPTPSLAAGFDPFELGPADAAVEQKAEPTPKGIVAPAKLVSSPGWSFESNVALRKLGKSVATAGDINRDGFSDVVALGEAGVNNIALYVYLGSPAGLVLAPGYPLTNLPQSNTGSSACGVGDVNGDGYGDVAVGLAQATSGSFRVYYGSANGLQATGFFNQFVTGGSFADVVKPAGDVNGDGFDDVLVGSSQAPSSIFYCGSGSNITGTVAIYYGSVSGVSAFNQQIALGCEWTSSNGGFGRAISTAGDVNADGYDDILIGATGGANYGQGPRGAVWVCLGSPSGLPIFVSSANLIDLMACQRLEGYSIGTEFGAAVSTAGDVNADGYADIAVSAPYEDTFGSDGGLVWVFSGGPAGADTTNKLWYESTGLVAGHMGLTITPAGDHNGDGRPDLLVGYATQTYLVTGVGGSIGMFISQTLPYPPFSFPCETAGDVNGDGVSDVVVGDGSYSNGEASEGRLMVHYGTGDGPAPSSSWEITTSLDNPNLGWSVASVGDVNGDGYDDFAAGAPTWDNFSTGETDNGAVFLYFGGIAGPSTSYNWFSFGTAGEQLGISVASAGDVNGDGYGDMVVGAHAAGNGKAMVWYGGPGGPGVSPNRVLTGASFASNFGSSVACAGDVNGDGYADVVVGAPLDEDPTVLPAPLSAEGRAFLYLGGAGGLAASPSWSDRGGQADAHYGSTVASIGDANGDGFSDVVVGAPDFDSSSGPLHFADTGRISIFRGQPAGTPLAFHSMIQGPVNGRFGASAAGAGDVNGDGYSDLVVGAPNSLGQGLVAVYPGSPSGISPAGMWTQFGGETSGGFGSSVASAGDINGDGLSDVLVGAVFQDGGGAQDRGYAAVYLGPLPGGAAPAWSVYGPSTFANLGHCVANAGDVNGDGWSDLLFGMPGYSNSFFRQGLCRLYRGANGTAVVQRSFAFRPLASRLVQPLGLTDPNLVGIGVTGRSAAGKTKVRFEWRVLPVVGLAAPALTGLGSYLATGAPGAFGSNVGLVTYENRLVNGIPYSWQVRSRSRSLYFPTSIWSSPVRSGAREWDMRAPGSWLAVPVASDPVGLELAGAAPNPMRSSSLISFRLSREGPVTLTIVDVQGRKVRELARGALAAGPHQVSWDGRDESARALGAGLYFVRLEAEERVMSGKVTLLR